MWEATPVPGETGAVSDRANESDHRHSWRTAQGFTDLVLVVVVVASLFGRYSISVGRLTVRPEHAATGVLLVWTLLGAARRRAALARLRDPMVVLLAAWLGIGVVSTALFAPSRSGSLPILGWLVSDLILLVCLLAVVDRLGVAERTGAVLVVPWAALGVGAVVAAVHGWLTWGVQFDDVFHVYAAYATAYEANIFAAFVAAWALVLVWRDGHRLWVAVLAAVIVPLAILAGQTRASLAALALGLVLMLAMTWRMWWGSPRWWVTTRAAVLMLAGLAVIAVVGPVKSFGQAPGATAGGANGATPSISAFPSPTSPSPTSPSPTSPSARPTATAAPPTPTATPQPDKITHFGFGDNFEFRRIVAQTAMSDMAGVRWLVGNGINTFGQRHDDPTQAGVPGYISSLPIQVLYDTGIAGVAVFVGFVIAAFRRVPAHRRSLAIPVAASLAVTSTFTSSLWFSTTWIMVAVLVRPTTRAYAGVTAQHLLDGLGDPTVELVAGE